MDAGKMDHLEQVAMHDSLTGLGNRALLWEHLQDLIEQNEMFSVLFMDLDQFKQVSTGLLLCEPPHKTIDEILQQVDHSMYQKKHEK